MRPSSYGVLLLTSSLNYPETIGLDQGATVELDGVREAAWDRSESFPITNSIDRAPDNEDDASGSWSALWNDFAIYFFVTVTDDDLRNDSSNWREDDGVEILLDFGSDRNDTDLDGDNHQIVAPVGARQRCFRCARQHRPRCLRGRQ